MPTFEEHSVASGPADTIPAYIVRRPDVVAMNRDDRQMTMAERLRLAWVESVSNRMFQDVPLHEATADALEVAAPMDCLAVECCSMSVAQADDYSVVRNLAQQATLWLDGATEK